MSRHRWMGLAVALGLGFAMPAIAEAPQAESPASYSEHGADTCLQCHNEAPATDILKTAHNVKGGPFAQHGCEACHGPSAAHVAGFAAGKLMPPNTVFDGADASPVAQRNQACLNCHQDKRMTWQGGQPANWWDDRRHASPHHDAGLACVSCHTLHAARDAVRVRTTQAEKCFACHADQKTESARRSHHPIRSARVVCSDCHDPHGSDGPALLKKATVNATCTGCHADKRRASVSEHPPVRQSCLNCHVPHGSDGPFLLKTRTVEATCYACHAGKRDSMPGGHHQGGGNCLDCHAPHGSGEICLLKGGRSSTCANCHSTIPAKCDL
ncbi:MAG: hypothetical protein KGJ78_07385 [Alphaproteobacteria bacterium]|nr:hypothetical protein [Alphaproteobacteria bacterium]